MDQELALACEEMHCRMMIDMGLMGKKEAKAHMKAAVLRVVKQAIADAARMPRAKSLCSGKPIVCRNTPVRFNVNVKG